MNENFNSSFKSIQYLSLSFDSQTIYEYVDIWNVYDSCMWPNHRSMSVKFDTKICILVSDVDYCLYNEVLSAASTWETFKLKLELHLIHFIFCFVCVCVCVCVCVFNYDYFWFLFYTLWCTKGFIISVFKISYKQF